MDFTLLEKDTEDMKQSFILKNSVPAMANALRRAMTDYVPTLAIETVEFRKNSSVLYDEILAHRLGLIVLKTDLSTYVLPEKCKCKGEGCAHCQVKVTLKARGPKIVYAKDMKINDPKIKPVYPKTPIVKLLKDQELEFEAIAILGQGRDHMKFAPGLVWYKYRPVIEISRTPDNAEEVVKSCPKKVFVVKNSKLSVDKERLFECHLCGACQDISGGAVKLNEKDDEFIFYVESFGQLTCTEIINTAIDQLQEEVELFKKEFEEAIK